MSPPLRILFVVNALATAAAGFVLLFVPAAIPATVGITLPPDASFIAWLLGAAEWGVTALCIGALRSQEPAAHRLAAMSLLVFHAASGMADLLALGGGFVLTIALNLVLRAVMVAGFAVFGLRHEHGRSKTLN